MTKMVISQENANGFCFAWYLEGKRGFYYNEFRGFYSGINSVLREIPLKEWDAAVPAHLMVNK